jgi:hypothetical protein
MYIEAEQESPESGEWNGMVKVIIFYFIDTTSMEDRRIVSAHKQEINELLEEGMTEATVGVVVGREFVVGVLRTQTSRTTERTVRTEE